jgi:hypothetical protein
VDTAAAWLAALLSSARLALCAFLGAGFTVVLAAGFPAASVDVCASTKAGASNIRVDATRCFMEIPFMGSQWV